MLPPPSSPELPFPRKKLPSIRLIAPALATVLLVVVIVIVLQMARGATNTPHLASAAATATSTPSATVTTATVTTATGATPLPTSAGTPTTQTGDVRVTQNQDMRPACLDDPTPYTVVLFNAGTTTANWHVNIPGVIGLVPGNLTAGTSPLSSPLSSYPYWANAKPQDGAVAPGQTASFVMSPVWSMPCGGTTYRATVQLSFPSGTSQADIPLTYAGTGPARYSNVVLVSGSLNMTQSCPASGSAPAPFTFAIKNTGNYKAVPYFDTLKDTVGPNAWADIPSVADDPQAPDTHWLYPGETWTVTVAPRAGVLCDGTPYHVYIYANDAQGTTQTMTLIDTFN